MDEAYFVGRKAILAWINDTFALNYGKIEETCSGALACQIADAVFPGTVPMSKVKWGAKAEYEYVHNYKILQRVFQKKGVAKHVDVDKLIRGKYQDNLEFMQWMKRWFELNHGGAEYDSVARRSKAKGAPGQLSSKGSSENSSAAANRRPRQKPRAAAAASAAPAKSGSRRPTAGASSGEVKALRDQLSLSKEEVAELKLSVDGLEKERDFYFGKLRDIEILLQSYTQDGAEMPEAKVMSEQLFKILYATEDDFVVVDDEEGGEAGEDLRDDLDAVAAQ